VANVPASLAGEVRVGQSATFASPTLPGQQFRGRVTFIQPVIDPATRSLGVRVALPNPQGDLRPGLFGDIALQGDEGLSVLAVPRSALIDSGARKVALVQVAEGRFVPRQVVTGRVSGDSVEVLDGLAEGERVVVSANFLIDAESNLQSALQGMEPAAGKNDDGSTSNSPASEGPAAESKRDVHADHGAQKMPVPDPHAGHPTPEAAAPDPHANHGTPPEPSPDPHAGHDMSGMEH
jgi:Cu(I)/Ag(I) efflux system membrane fusion protein